MSLGTLMSFLYFMEFVPVQAVASACFEAPNSVALNAPAVACAMPLRILLPKLMVTMEPSVKVVGLAEAKLLSSLGAAPMILPVVVITFRPALDLPVITVRSQLM